MSYWVAHTDVPLAATYARGISMLHHSCSCRKDSVPWAAFWSAVFDNNVEGPTVQNRTTQLDHVDFRKPDERDQTESAVERSTHYQTSISTSLPGSAVLHARDPRAIGLQGSRTRIAVCRGAQAPPMRQTNVTWGSPQATWNGGDC